MTQIPDATNSKTAPKRKYIGWAIVLILIVLPLLVGLIFKNQIIKYVAQKFSPTNIFLNTAPDGKTNAKVYFKFKNRVIPKFIDSLEYVININTDIIGKGVKIMTNDKVTADSNYFLSLNINHKKYLRMLRTSTGQDAKLMFEAKVYILGSLFNGRAIKINKEADVKLHIQPEITVEKVDVEKFGLKNIQLQVYLNLKNRNNFNVKIQKLHYIFKVKEYTTAEGTIPQTFSIKPKQTTSTSISVDVDIQHLGQLLKTLLKNNATLPYRLDIKGNLNLVDSSMDDFNISTSAIGELDLKKAMKSKGTKKK